MCRVRRSSLPPGFCESSVTMFLDGHASTRSPQLADGMARGVRRLFCRFIAGLLGVIAGLSVPEA